MKKWYLAIAVAVILLAGVVVTIFLNPPITSFIDSPRTAIRVAQTNFIRTMWYHLDPRFYSFFKGAIQTPTAQIPGSASFWARPLSDGEREWLQSWLDNRRPDQIPFRYGSYSDVLNYRGGIWEVHYGNGASGDWVIALRETDGQILAVYYVPEG